MVSEFKKVFISIDMEGISCIVANKETVGPSKEYDNGQRLMVGDLNAAIEGALDAGVSEIVVSDAHWRMMNLLPEEVHEAAYLIRGSPKPGSMMSGISRSLAQSPPPMTFPALVLAMATLWCRYSCSGKKELR